MIISKTPYRISFFGGGTDFPHWYNNELGQVLSVSINKYSYVSCRFLPPFFDYKYRIRYYKREEVNSIEEIKHPVIRETLRRLGINGGLDLVHHGDLPARSGIGSSSSFTVGLLNSLNNLICRSQSKHKLAAEAIHIEQNILKESVGSQDQIAASFGGLNQIIFRPNKEFKVLPIKLDSNKKSSFEDHIQLFFTGLTRESSQIQKGHIKNIPKLAHELRLLTEQVNIASNILKNSINPMPEIGRLLNDQWQIKRTLNNAVTNSGIDRAYEMGLKSGAIGGKLLGAGGGGFLLFITEPDKHKSVVNSLPGLMNIPIKFDSTGSQIIYKPKE